MKNNGIIRGILPAIFLTLPIGSVYAFSIFLNDITTICGVSKQTAQLCFSLSIFFLGMGASFFGKLVEKNPKISGLLAGFLFLFGNELSAYGLFNKTFWMVLVGYGVLNGLGQGIGYLAPVKTLMMWYPNKKGLASSISIVSFGLGSTLCAFMFSFLNKPSPEFFTIMGYVYFMVMVMGSLLIKKPYNDQNNILTEFKYSKLFSDKIFWHSWLFMFLNISAGLAFIGCSVPIFKDAGITEKTILVLMMLAGIFNGSFRLVFAYLSDYIKPRVNVWLIISVLSVAFLSVGIISYALIGISVLLINATYGGGFSTCPSVLSEYYPVNNLSKIHGAVLSAWGFAGLIGNNIGNYILTTFGGYWIAVFLIFVYFLNAYNVSLLRKYKHEI